LKNQPIYLNKKFVCPHCNTLAQQGWISNKNIIKIVNDIYKHNYLNYRESVNDYEQKIVQRFLEYMNSTFPSEFRDLLPSAVSISKCHACEDFSIWFDENIIYPKKTFVEPPNNDLNDDIKELYYEAAIILIDSPKGSTAILRLALQKLLVQLGKNGKNINNDIKELVKEGLNPKMQKALDTLRVIGNNAVHPGQINLDDNKDIALHLFKILNMVADDMITKPKEMDTLYDNIIPEDTKNHIKQRDSKT
jgi:hypothetical protein